MTVVAISMVYSPQIKKLFISNFLTGLVFWYSIEKIFQASIGIDARGVGIITLSVTAVTLLLDVPFGMLADRWSRRGVLFFAPISLGIGSLLLAQSNSLLGYVAGSVVYAFSIVTTNGIYQALMYDSLHEEGLTEQYSRIGGRAYASFLLGTGVANVLGGVLAGHLGLRVPFYLSIVSCVINLFVIANLREPKFHKPEHREKIAMEMIGAMKILFGKRALRGLAVISSLFMIIEIFKLDFAQLYFLNYFSSPQALGRLWALYSLTFAVGGLVAHHFKKRINLLVLLSTLPLLLMALIDNRFIIVLFNVQVVAGAALANQIESRVQARTPAHLRASVISALHTSGRVLALPSTLIMGWSIAHNGAVHTVKLLNIVTILIIATWVYTALYERKKGYQKE